MKIRTNHQYRPFRHRAEVHPKALANELDWTSEDEHPGGYFQYHGTWYHISQFLWGAPEGWDGVHASSLTTGLLLKLSEDRESCKVASFRV